MARTAALPPSDARDAKLARELDRYVRSGGVKAAHLKKYRHLKRRPDQVIFRLADRFDCLTACHSPVPWFLKAKRSGGSRQVCKPPPKLWLGQTLARKAITNQLTPVDALYDWPGRGIHRHVADIRNALAARGPHVFMLDIKDCFDSVDPGAVYGLDLLPRELIESCIDSRLLTFRHSIHTEDLSLVDAGSNLADPRGLLQGGPASSAIVVALLGNVFRGLNPCLWAGGIADDFIIIGGDRAMVDDAGGELARYLTGCALGPSKFHTATADVRDGFQHVGCLFQKIGDDIECWIPEGKLDALLARMEAEIRNPCDDDRGKRVDHFAAKALGPYSWAADWQKEHVREHAADVWLTVQS